MLTDKQTDRETNAGHYITSLAGVIKPRRKCDERERLSGVQDTEWVADELRVTCLLNTSSCLWVGTADGTLLIYDVSVSQTTDTTITDDETTSTTMNVVSDQSKIEVDLLISTDNIFSTQLTELIVYNS